MTAINDDSNEKRDEIERMSLADLLSMSGEGDGRVQEREDEPGSGIAKLAQMVAASSIVDAKRPSLMPPMGSSPPQAAPSMPPMGSVPPMGSMPPQAQASMPPMMGSMPPAGPSVPPMSGGMPAGASMPPMGSMPPSAAGMYGTAPMGSMPPQAAAVPGQGYAYGAGQMGMSGAMEDTLEKPKKSSKLGLFIGIGVGVAVLGVLAYFLLSGSEPPPAPEEDPQLAKLQAQLNDLKAAQATPPAAPAAAPTPAAADEKPAEPAAAVAEVKPSEEAAAKAAASEEAADEEAAEEPSRPMTKAEKKKAAKAAKAAKKAGVVAPKPAKEPKEKDEKETKPAGGGLGALLDDDVASGKKSAGELPKTPSRADVKSAMQPVQAKASKCAKYSKGTVQLKLVVGSDGRVQSSTPVGGSADQTAANCVSMIARTARFPRFKDPTFSINYPVTLK